MSYSYGKSIVTDGLVFYVDAGNIRSYPGSGTTWTDLIGSDDATLTNGPTYSSGNGGYFNMDGVDDILTVGSTGIDVYSISMWVYLNNTVTASTTNMGLSCLNGSDGTGADPFQGGLTFGSTTSYATSETLTILDGDALTGFGRTYIRDTIPTGWNYITLNWNGSHYDFYIDGVAKTTYAGSTSGSGDGHTPLTTASNLVIGASYYSTGLNTFGGRVATCAIYDSSLTAAEITQNYNALKNRFL